MTRLLNSVPVATILVALAFVLVTLVGGIVTIVHPDSLPFDHYVAAVTGLAASAGLLGIGRGVHANANAKATVLASAGEVRSPATGRFTRDVPPPT